jgi:hypothetical protein
MSSIQMTPDRYRKILSEYDTILAYARETSNRLAGRLVVAKHLSYAETIFTKLVCHAISLRSLAPTLQPESKELWDIGALCAVARTLVEAFDALAYISLHAVTPAEREIRILAWELHEREHRLHMLEDIRTSGPDVDAIRRDAEALHAAVTSHAFYLELPKDMRGKIATRKTPAFLRSQKERNVASGINSDFYNSVTMYLSQYVHTLPLALSQLMLTHAGDPGALQLVAMPLQYSMAFIAKASVGIVSLWPDVRIEMAEQCENVVNLWLSLAEKGVKGLGS